MPKKAFDLLQDDPKKLFARYLLPSISATFVTSIYIIVDTIMIGRGCGSDALIALNLALPIFSILYACGMLLGVGGGVLLSVARGAGDEHRATQAFSTALATVGVLAAIAMLCGTLFLTPLCRLLGADTSNLSLVREYAKFLVYFAPFFVFSTFLQAIVRNDHDPKRAMAAVLSGAITNIVFDYIFIFTLHMGMAGGAAATVIGNALTVIILLSHFYAPGNSLRFSRKAVSWNMLRQIVPSGAPSALIEVAQGIVTFSFNLQLLRFLGQNAVAIYSIIANCAFVGMSLFNGVSQAAQPVIAANHGANQPHRVASVRRAGLLVALGVGIVLTSTAYWMPHTLISLFVHPTAALLSQGTPILRIYFVAFVPMGLNLFLSTYFQSRVCATQSLLLTLLRGIALPLLLVLALPVWFGAHTIWLTVPLTEMLTLLCGIVLLRHERAD